MFCDLHVHSTASDGTDAPEQLAMLAKAAGLAAIALTDHDTTAGLSAAARACAEAGIAFAPGIEVSANPAPLRPPAAAPDDDTAHASPQSAPPTTGTLHILGLFIRHDDPMIAAISRRMQQAREQRNPAIVARLAVLGVRIEYSEVVALAQREGAATIGRPHIAQVMLEKGYVKSIQDAFARYLGAGGAAYVRRDRLHPREAIEAIHHAGGLAALAHPVQLKCADDDALAYAVRRLTDLGLDAIETRHSDHSAADTQRLQRLAERLNLLTTGGSDYHGSRKTIALGSQRVPLAVFDRLRGALVEA